VSADYDTPSAGGPGRVVFNEVDKNGVVSILSTPDAGGPVRTEIAGVGSVGGAAWVAQGTLYYLALMGSGVRAHPLAGGPDTLLYAIPAGLSNQSLTLSPDGQEVAVDVLTKDGSSTVCF